MKNPFLRFDSFFINMLLISIAAISIVGCDDDDDDEVVEPVSIAYVSLYHASPDAPPVDILMENRQINYYPLQYSRYTGYLNFYSGERNMRVRPATDANVILDTTLTFNEGEAYSLFYVNPLSDFQVLLIEDDFVIPEAGNAAVRFVHLSPDAPAVDAVRTVGDDNGGSSMVADAQSYMEASAFMTVESGVQSFEVRSDDGGDVLLNIPDVNLLSGGVYTIVARGYHSPSGGNANNLGAQILVNY